MSGVRNAELCGAGSVPAPIQRHVALVRRRHRPLRLPVEAERRNPATVAYRPTDSRSVVHG